MTPARRFEDIAAHYLEAILAAPEERQALVVKEMETAFANYTAQQWAEFSAYCVCPNCRRIYTEGEFSQLLPSREGLSRKDEYELLELRTCEVCGQQLERALETYKPRPPPGVRLQVVASQRLPCCHCRGWAGPGQHTAVVKGDKLGSLCPECEGAK